MPEFWEGFAAGCVVGPLALLGVVLWVINRGMKKVGRDDEQ